MNAHLLSLIPALAGRRILVIGDVILDEYLTGSAARISREAPIPVLEFVSRRAIPGGAANPAANIAALGSHALQVGVVGADAAGDGLRAALADAGIDARGLVTDSDRPTTLKTRIMAQMGLRFPQQVARLDTLSRAPISPAVERQVCDVALALLDGPARIDAVLCSDYHGGLLTPSLVACLREAAAARGALLTADAQGQLDKYSGFGLVKCNADEAREWLRAPLHGDADFAEAALALRARLRLAGDGVMAITRGPDGITLADAAGATHCPAPRVTDVFDTVGAGDTAIAVMTLAACAGLGYADAARLANYAGGVVVRRVGNYAPTPDDLRGALAGDNDKP